MYLGHKVIVVTPAGRRQYLRLLFNYISQTRSRGIIDEYHLWINTPKEEDRVFCKNLERTFPRFVKAIPFADWFR